MHTSTRLQHTSTVPQASENSSFLIHPHALATAERDGAVATAYSGPRGKGGIRLVSLLVQETFGVVENFRYVDHVDTVVDVGLVGFISFG
jgi:hypothetical protein